MVYLVIYEGNKNSLCEQVLLNSSSAGAIEFKAAGFKQKKRQGKFSNQVDS